MRVLIVDDDKIIRMGLSKKIKRMFNEYEVIDNFTNGSNAFDYLKENNAEVVITDIKMPVMTGIELIEKARKTLKNPPEFIVLSGYDDFSYVRDSMRRGAVNYLLKPVVEEELKKALGEAEVKVKELRKEDRLKIRSIDILQKDFFRSILFGKNDIKNQRNKVLKNVFLNEYYIYKMIAVERYPKDLNEFINTIVTSYKGIKYSHYFFENMSYIIFYCEKDNIDMGDFIKDITRETEKFIRDNSNVYIFDEVENPWTLRKNLCLVRSFLESDKDRIKAKRYYFNSKSNLNEILEEEEDKDSKKSIKLAKEYIKNNYNKNINLKAVADKIFLSQNYLSELFKKETGEGFYEFLSNYRIKKAKEILMATNLKVYEVAQRVGYSDSITFGRAFKKKTGRTPNGYRNDILSSNKEE